MKNILCKKKYYKNDIFKYEFTEYFFIENLINSYLPQNAFAWVDHCLNHLSRPSSNTNVNFWYNSISNSSFSTIEEAEFNIEEILNEQGFIIISEEKYSKIFNIF